MGGWVYIMASAPYGTLYVGVTSDISRRVYEHREGVGSDFCRTYGVKRLVYTEGFEDISNAIRREKRLKKHLRAWKIKLIEDANPSSTGVPCEPPDVRHPPVSRRLIRGTQAELGARQCVKAGLGLGPPDRVFARPEDDGYFYVPVIPLTTPCAAAIP